MNSESGHDFEAHSHYKMHMSKPDYAKEPLADRMVTPERSVFGTRSPRPVGVGRHLVVVVVLVLVALVVAIVLAETGNDSPPEAPKDAKE